MKEVRLTWHEAAMASEIGRLRQLSSLRSNRQDQHGYAGEGWNIHIEGACGELALAKALNTYWNGSVNTFKDFDVLDLQVRTAPSHSHRLIVRPADPDQHRFVLVTGRCPNYRVHGWILGCDAKRVEWLAEEAKRPAAFFVPAAALQSIEALEATL